MKKIIFFLLLSFVSLSAIASDTVYLKSGDSIEGVITEQTDEYIKLDFEGVSLTYQLSDIDRIKQNSQSQAKKDAVSLGEEILEDQGKVFLWEVSSDKNAVYILGSIHTANEELYPLDQRIENAFSSSDILAVEVNLKDKDATLIQNMFMEKGLYKDGDSLDKHISDRTFELLQQYMADLEVNASQMMKYKPWFLAINLVNFELLKLGFDPNFGIEQYFFRKLRATQRIVEIESIEYQIDLFDSFSDQQQDLFLFSTLLDIDIIDKEFNSMLKAWSEGDTGKLEDILKKGLKTNPEILPIYEKIFIERNKSMAVKIEKFLNSDDNYFVIVGAGHLVGAEGIIGLLRQKGYFLQQM